MDASNPLHNDEVRMFRKDRRIVVQVSKESAFSIDWEIIKSIAFRHVVPKPRADCSKGEQLIVTFAAGYIAGLTNWTIFKVKANFNCVLVLLGVFCAIVSHPADVVVSKLNQAKGASALDVAKKLGFMGMWNGLTPRIIMIGTLTALQWFIYDGVKVNF